MAVSEGDVPPHGFDDFEISYTIYVIWCIVLPTFSISAQKQNLLTKFNSIVLNQNR